MKPIAVIPYRSISSTHCWATSVDSSGSSMEVMSVLERVLCSKPSRVLPLRLQAFSVLAVKKWAWASTTSIPTFDNISDIHPTITLEIAEA